MHSIEFAMAKRIITKKRKAKRRNKLKARKREKRERVGLARRPIQHAICFSFFYMAVMKDTEILCVFVFELIRNTMCVAADIVGYKYK